MSYAANGYGSLGSELMFEQQYPGGPGRLVQAQAGYGYFGGFGMTPDEFNPAAVLADWKAGGLAGKRASNVIKAALDQLGYGPMSTSAGGEFTQADYGRYNAMARATGTPTQFFSMEGFTAMRNLLSKGGTPGGGPPIVSVVTPDGGRIVGGAAGAKLAGMSTGMKIGLAAAAAALIGAVAFAAKKRKGGGAAYATT
jgi:hypothetical protein